MNTTKILYLSYDGMTDTLGQSQVISYLIPLANKGFIIHIVSFEKKEIFEKKRSIVEQRIKGTDIVWHPLAYTKNPPVLSTLKDIRKGWNKIKSLHQQLSFDIVHCRGYIPALLGLQMKKRWGVKFIFDMRGWWADEKKESGNWRNPVFKPVYDYFKRREREFFVRSDYTVSLTFRGKEEIIKNNWKEPQLIGVIPTCVDFKIFPDYNERTREKIRKKLAIPTKATVLVYSGSVGGNYKPEDFVAVYRSFLNVFPDGFFLILSSTAPSNLKASFKREGVDVSKIIITSVNFDQVNQYLMASDIGLILYELTFSVIGRSPTKLGEYWAEGIPVLSLKGIGDLEEIQKKYTTGVVLLKALEEPELSNAFQQLELMDDRSTLRRNAIDYFDLHKGVNFYADVYNKLTTGN